VTAPAPDELAAEQRTNQREYWAPWVERHERLPLIAAWPRLTEWGVLGVARQLHTIRTGEVVSKTRAGELLFARIGAEHHAVTSDALAIRRGEPRTVSLRRSQQDIRVHEGGDAACAV